MGSLGDEAKAGLTHENGRRAAGPANRTANGSEHRTPLANDSWKHPTNPTTVRLRGTHHEITAAFPGFAMTTVVVAAAVAAAAVALVVIFALVWSRRSATAQDDRIAAVVSDMNERMEAMLQELSAALQRAEEESRRSRTLGELTGS